MSEEITPKIEHSIAEINAARARLEADILMLAAKFYDEFRCNIDRCHIQAERISRGRPANVEIRLKFPE